MQIGQSQRTDECNYGIDLLCLRLVVNAKVLCHYLQFLNYNMFSIEIEVERPELKTANRLKEKKAPTNES